MRPSPLSSALTVLFALSVLFVVSTGCRNAGTQKVELTIHTPAAAPAIPVAERGTATALAPSQPASPTRPGVIATGTGTVVINIIHSSTTDQAAGKTLDNVGNPDITAPLK